MSEEKNVQEVAKETKGFQSYITVEETEMLIKFVESAKKFEDYFREKSMKMLEDTDESEIALYSKLQYAMFIDILRKGIGNLDALVVVHEIDKEYLDASAEEQELSFKEFAHKTLDGILRAKIAQEMQLEDAPDFLRDILVNMALRDMMQK